METLLKDYLQPLSVIFGIVFALYQYAKQNKFKRLQNLSGLWKQFHSNEQLLLLFHLMNEIEVGNKKTDELLHYSPQLKFQFLALIEEVALFNESFEVDTPYTSYLFQWHFYFIYQSQKTNIAFWGNLGGANEMNATYWEKSRILSHKFIPKEV